MNSIYPYLRFCNTCTTNKESPRLLASILVFLFVVHLKFCRFQILKEKRKRFYVNMLRQRMRCLYFNFILFYRRVGLVGNWISYKISVSSFLVCMSIDVVFCLIQFLNEIGVFKCVCCNNIYFPVDFIFQCNLQI